MEKEIKIEDKVRVTNGIFCGQEGSVTKIEDQVLHVELNKPMKLKFFQDQNDVIGYLDPPSAFKRLVGNKRYFELIDNQQ